MSGYKLRAKLFYAHHGHGQDKQYLDNGHAEPGDEPGRYIIHAPSGKTYTLREGDYLEGLANFRRLGPLSFSQKHQCVHLGPYSLPLGRVTPGWRAKPMGRGRRYLISRTDGTNKPFTITLGEPVRSQPGVPDECIGKSPFLDKAGNLQLGLSIKPMQKEYELNLIVMDKKERGGHLAYFNVIEPGARANRRDGTRGVFYQPRRPGQPAAFCETFSEDGKPYRTAIFWPTRNHQYANGQFRTLEDAVMEKRLYDEIKNIKTNLEQTDPDLSSEALVDAAREIGIDLEAERARLKQANERWTNAFFTVAEGCYFVFEHSLDNERTPEPEM